MTTAPKRSARLRVLVAFDDSDGSRAAINDLHRAGFPAEADALVGDTQHANLADVIEYAWAAEWNDNISAAVQIKLQDGTVTLVQAGPT